MVRTQQYKSNCQKTNFAQILWMLIALGYLKSLAVVRFTPNYQITAIIIHFKIFPPS